MPDCYKVLLLFGPPGSGKGTQGRILGRIPGLVHLATGDMFRSLDPDSDLGRRVTAYSARGELVPDELTMELWRSHVRGQVEKGLYDPRAELLLLDGIPRSAAQASMLDGSVSVLQVVHLKPDGIDELVARMKRRATQEGRTDDARESVIRRRFEVYDEETSLVLAHYDPALISEVPAVGSPVEVVQRILEVLVPIYRQAGLANPLEK
jgi:adenylate kinase